MSTQDTKFRYKSERDKHNLIVNVYQDMHESLDTYTVEMGCDTCHCSYKMTMTQHLGEALVDLLEKAI